MTTSSPWAGPTATPATPAPAPPSVAGPPPQFNPTPEPRKPRRWTRRVGAAVAILALMAVTAAVTHQLTRTTQPVDAATPASSEPEVTPVKGPGAPAASAAEVAAANNTLCGVFDATTKGTKGKGGVMKDGELNMPVVVRTLGSVIAVEQALSGPVAPELSSTARQYADANLALANAALANENVASLSRLTNDGNNATIALARGCGLA